LFFLVNVSKLWSDFPRKNNYSYGLKGKKSGTAFFLLPVINSTLYENNV